MSKITTLQIGGPAKKFVSVKTQKDLIEAIQYAKQHNWEYLIIGGGSNLLVNDAGVDCLVIKNEITGITSQSRTLRVASGTLLQDFVNYTIEHGLSGSQKLTGIPGTIGGAVYGNAGAYGQTISDHITSIVILSESKNLITLTKDKSGFGYRDSAFKQRKNIILEVSLQLKKGDSKNLQRKAEEVLQKRLIKYPVGIKCPGSFFKNIVAITLPKDILDKIPSEKIIYGKLPAGTLLEMVGAKGEGENGIKIADYHANLFVNKGNGTAKDFYALAKKYAIKVKEKFGITLEPEVQLINLPPLI